MEINQEKCNLINFIRDSDVTFNILKYVNQFIINELNYR